MGVIDEATIAAELGLDIDDVYAERARCKALRESYGLPEPTYSGKGGDDDDDDEKEGGKDGGKSAGSDKSD